MTEQEKRDNLIMEMAQQLCEAAGISCQNCPKAHSPEEFGECELPGICNTLADYVLRKEEEVKKETANRFLSVINSLLDDVEKGSITTFEELQLQLIYNVHFLRKEFGVKEENNDKRKGSKNTLAKAK